MKTLIVDDGGANPKLLRVQLEAEGHVVVEAVDGIEALDLLRREFVEGVIADILMPNRDGYRYCDTFRRDPKLDSSLKASQP